MTCRSSAVCALVALSGTLVLSGCSNGNREFTLKGSVSYQGKPLPSGVIRLYMTENRVTMAMIQPDGSFEATGVFAGEAKVTVEEDPGAKMRRTMPRVAAGGPKAAAGANPSPVPSVPLPVKYKDVNTADLVFTLKRGQPLNVELK